MMNMDDMTEMMNLPLVWVFIAVAIVIIVLLVLFWVKLSSISRTSKQYYQDLSKKIDSLSRTSDAFSELNAKIDRMNNSSNESKRSTPEDESTI